MTTPPAIPPAAITFADDTLAIELPTESIHLLTIYGTASDSHHTIGAVLLAAATRAAALPAILHGLATRNSHRQPSRLPILGYGVAAPRDGQIVLVDRHAQIATLTTATPTALPCGERDIAITEALIAMVATGPGIYTPAPAIPAATRARIHLRAIPARSPRPGDVAVFAPHWAHARDQHSRHYIRGGYTGVLRSGAAFACTRTVADSIVADHQRTRADHGERLRQSGYHGDHLATALDRTIATIGWDGDEIVVDQRPLTADSRDLYRIRPCHDGTYLISATTGTWTAVDPEFCEHIDGRPNPLL